jgi:protein-tyrosine phosphatase
LFNAFQNSGDKQMLLAELPFELPGRIYGSPMPFGDYDPEGEVLLEFRQKEISVIVLLAEEEECLRKAGRNLQFFYMKKGYQVIYLPIRDFDVPPRSDLESAVAMTVRQARSGRNIVIHCHAGLGRTGVFAAFLAKEVFDLSGEEAFHWVRRYIPGALETNEQKQFVVGEGA